MIGSPVGCQLGGLTYNDVGAHSGVEQEADAFASQILIPRSAEPDLSTLDTSQEVEQFADRIGIAPGIVVGRLQHGGRWPYNRGNELSSVSYSSNSSSHDTQIARMSAVMWSLAEVLGGGVGLAHG